MTSSPRTVLVPPERLPRWRENFATRHGGPATAGRDGDAVVLRAPDGATATASAPFGPLGAVDGDPWDALVAHAELPRTFALLLVRLGGYGVGVVEGRELVVSKVGSRQVHGRSSAGGWSQQRFARRREGQVRVALTAAADTAARVLLPHADRIGAVLLGGDRTAAEEVLTDPRLAVLAARRTEPFLTVADPRHVVLVEAVGTARSATVVVADPA